MRWWDGNEWLRGEVADFHDYAACIAAAQVDVEEYDRVSRVACSWMSAWHA